MRPSQIRKRKRKKAKQWEFNLKKFRRDLRRYLHTEKSPNYIVLIENHYYGTFCNWNKGFKITDTTVSLDTEKTYNSISRVAKAFGLHLDLLYEYLYVEDPIKKKHKLSRVKLSCLRWNFKQLRELLCSNTTHKIEDKKRYDSVIKDFAEHIRKRYEESVNKKIETIVQKINSAEELKEETFIADNEGVVNDDDNKIIDILEEGVDEKKPADDVRDDNEEEEEEEEEEEDDDDDDEEEKEEQNIVNKELIDKSYANLEYIYNSGKIDKEMFEKYQDMLIRKTCCI